MFWSLKNTILKKNMAWTEGRVDTSIKDVNSLFDFELCQCSSMSTPVRAKSRHMSAFKLSQSFILSDGFMDGQQFSFLFDASVIFRHLDNKIFLLFLFFSNYVELCGKRKFDKQVPVDISENENKTDIQKRPCWKKVQRQLHFELTHENTWCVHCIFIDRHN